MQAESELPVRSAAIHPERPVENPFDLRSIDGFEIICHVQADIAPSSVSRIVTVLLL